MILCDYSILCHAILYGWPWRTANLCTKTLDFRGFDSSVISMLRGGTLVFKGNSPEIMSRAILAGIILEGRLGVRRRAILGHSFAGPCTFP